MLSKLAAIVLLLFVLGTTPLRAEGPSSDNIKTAVNRSVVLLQKSGAEYLRKRECFSCHHQAVPILALTTARDRGFEIDEEGLQKQVKHTVNFLEKNRENYLKGRGQGGQVDTAGYALLALEAGGWKPDATTAAVAEYLLLRDKDGDHWRAVSKRPPSEISPFTATYVALRGLQAFGTEEQKERVTARSEQVRRWLLKASAEDTEDRVFRLGAMKRVGVEEKEVQALVKELLKQQRKDGGWSQTDDLESDAYATGSVLVVLHQAGGLATTDPAYQRGLKFLVDGQLEDGSWLVKSRSRPFQTYFESGFPHEKNQFISIAASAWATTALTLACPPPASKER